MGEDKVKLDELLVDCRTITILLIILSFFLISREIKELKADVQIIKEVLEDKNK